MNAAPADLRRLIDSIAAGDAAMTQTLLSAAPELATAQLDRHSEYFNPIRHAQLYAGDTALHAAAFTYDCTTAQLLLSLAADIDARNRRGAQPLHSAMIGAPGSTTWDPERQRDIILLLIDAGADPNARASGGVTPLHRAVRNRCSAAVDTLLRCGADPRITNDSGSTALDLTRWTTGRSGSGSEAARAEQELIVELLAAFSRRGAS